MTRKHWGLLGLLLLIAASGCGLRKREGLLARCRGRSNMPEANDCPPYGGGFSMPSHGGYFGAPSAMPCSMPGQGSFPFSTMPHAGGVPMMSPETLTPQPFPGTMMPPFQTVPPIVTPPGSAAPRPADPSIDPASQRKGNGLVNSKPTGTP